MEVRSSNLIKAFNDICMLVEGYCQMRADADEKVKYNTALALIKRSIVELQKLQDEKAKPLQSGLQEGDNANPKGG